MATYVSPEVRSLLIDLVWIIMALLLAWLLKAAVYQTVILSAYGVVGIFLLVVSVVVGRLWLRQRRRERRTLQVE